MNNTSLKINWKFVCAYIFGFTGNAKPQLIQYKVLHRAHITTHKLFWIGLIEKDTCPYCPNSRDDYYHSLWLCPHTSKFQSGMIEKISEIVGSNIPICPVLTLLGDTSRLELPRHTLQFLLVAFTMAKKLILLYWKSRLTLSINSWLTLLTDHSNM